MKVDYTSLILTEVEKRDITVDIEVTGMPTATVNGKSHLTCPADLLKRLSKSDAQGVIVAEVGFRHIFEIKWLQDPTYW